MNEIDSITYDPRQRALTTHFADGTAADGPPLSDEERIILASELLHGTGQEVASSPSGTPAESIWGGGFVQTVDDASQPRTAPEIRDDEGVRPHLPACLLEPLGVTPDPDRLLTHEQVGKIWAVLAASSPRNRALGVLIGMYGFRAGAIAELPYDALGGEEVEGRMIRQLHVPTSTGIARRVDLLDSAFHALLQWKAHRDQSLLRAGIDPKAGPLFSRMQGRGVVEPAQGSSTGELSARSRRISETTVRLGQRALGADAVRLTCAVLHESTRAVALKHPTILADPRGWDPYQVFPLLVTDQ